MRYLSFLLAVSCWAGQGLKLSNVRVQNGSFTAQSHSVPVIVEFELSDWSSVTTNDSVALLDGVGLAVDFQSSTLMRVADNWGTGAATVAIPLSLFANNYLYFRYQHDQAGTLGPAMTDYIQAWDHLGVLQFSVANSYSADNPSYNFGGLYVAQNGNATVQTVHFVRSGTTLVPIASRSPATADTGPLNSGSWAFQWKFDGSLADASGNGWTPAMYDSSTPSGTCGSTATSYCNTLYQSVFPVITTNVPTWRAGQAQSPSGSSSFSQADSSSVISSYFWQYLSGPSAPVWSSHTTVSPSLSVPIAGDYNIQLQVKDAASQVATATQHIGVVATDSNDIVINNAALPTNSITDVILGPLQKWESSLAPYPLFDVLHGEQWTLRSGPSGDFQTDVNGGSSFQSGTAYFDYAQPGTITCTQFSYICAGSGTSWLTTIGDAGDASAYATIYTSVAAGTNTSAQFTITSSNDAITLAFDGGSPKVCTLTTGARNPQQVATDIQSCIGAAGTAAPDYNGLLIAISTATMGTSGSVAVQTVANNAYATLGLTVGTYTVANNPQVNMEIIPFYLTSTLSTPNPAYATGRRQLNIVQVLSNTSIVIEQANGFGWRLPTQTGVQYAIDSQAWGPYTNFSNNGNYYMVDLADWAKAIQSGLAADAAQARARSDRWWRSPIIDLGQEYTTSSDMTTFTGSGRQVDSRLLALNGTILRALDGNSTYWTGIEYIIEQDVAKITGPGSSITDLYFDQREFGDALQRISLCAQYDPGSYAATCRATLVSVTANVITPSRNTVDSAYPYWPVLYFASPGSWTNGSSVSVTNGSVSVVGTGTTFPLSCTGLGTLAMWFFPTPGTRPASNSVGDSTWYTPTCVDGTHMTLDRNYAGTTSASKGYALYYDGSANPFVGWGAQPFMEATTAAGFAMASLATACVSPGVPTNCDNPTSVLLKGYVSDAAQWMVNVGYQSSTQGVYQGANFVNCTPPSSNALCEAGNLPYGARVIGLESNPGIAWAYRLSGTAAFKTNADAMFSANWTNSGGLPDYNPPSGQYVQTPGVVSSPKYHGLAFGQGQDPAWQAIDLCAGGSFPCLSPLAAPVTRTIYLNYSPSDVTNATSVHITVTQPDGVQVTTTCTSAPCSVTGDARQGTHLVQAQYFNSGGKALSQTSVGILVVQ
jgi:hypothetical protein